MRRPPRRAFGPVLVIAAATTACNDPGASWPDAGPSIGSGAGGAPTTTSMIEAATSTSTGPPPPPCSPPPASAPPHPEGIPTDWSPFTCWGIGGDCILWVPPSPADAAPLLWEPCEFPGAPFDCEKFATPPIDGRLTRLDDVKLGPRASGGPVIGLERRITNPDGIGTARVDFLLAEEEGAVLAAASQVWATDPPTCGIHLDGLADGMAALNFFRGNNDDGLALLDASGLAMPWRDPGNDLNSWEMAPEHPLQRTYTTLVRHDLTFTTQEMVFDSNVVGLSPLSKIRTTGDDILIGAGSYGAAGVFAWSPATGLVTIERFPDSTRAALAIGGDGTHLVWTRGEGRSTPDAVEFIDYSIMVSPYTLEPSKIMPRRLRKDFNHEIGSPWHVGCGKAARDIGAVRAQIVDLETGVRWTVDPLPNSEWSWPKVIGITCEHVYLWASIKLGPGQFIQTLARVRLDSLGEGTPPD